MLILLGWLIFSCWVKTILCDFNITLDFLNAVNINSPSYMNAYCKFPDDFDYLLFYYEMTGASTLHFSPRISSSNYIIADHLRYIHRFLASHIQFVLMVPMW